MVLGIYDRCTPKLASDASRAVAMLSSLAEAQAQLRSEGIALDIKTLRSTAYRYAARARAAQQSAACGLLDRVTGKRVVVSLDGGRVRVRRKKRGPKTKKGRNRFHTDWKEPKLLILYVVGDDGRPSQTWAPIIDGTLRGPEAVFALLLSYARQIGLNAADKGPRKNNFLEVLIVCYRAHRSRNGLVGDEPHQDGYFLDSGSSVRPSLWHN